MDVISFRLPRRLAKRFRLRAAEHGVNLSQVLRGLVERWLDPPVEVHDGPRSCPRPPQTLGSQVTWTTEGPAIHPHPVVPVNWWCGTCGGRCDGTFTHLVAV